MKTKIELDKDDMKKIIAEHFSVNEDRVTVGAKEICVGCGMMEHNESVPYCIVEKDQREKPLCDCESGECLLFGELGGNHA